MDIAPGQELLISYGKAYAKSLDIWTEYNYSNVSIVPFSNRDSWVFSKSSWLVKFCKFV